MGGGRTRVRGWGLRFLERRELRLSTPTSPRRRKLSWERSEYLSKVTPRADGGGGI